MLAGFVRYALQIAPTLSISVGGRVDWLHDAFEARAPSGGAPESATHVAFSPKIGASFRYVGSDRHTGHLYANVARSFKAPTPDQLFDQRTVPVPFPPYAITFANAALRPQYGTNKELGAYHRAVIAPGALAADLTVAVYQLDLRDELDFDLQSFRYANIGQSRHRGLETGLKLDGPHTLALFANYTLQAATTTAGDNAGKYLKAIPHHFVTAGVTVGSSSGPAASVVMLGARRIYLDDANTQELPGWTRWDARVSYSVRGVRLSADVFNLLDAKYSTTGFPDPADPGVVHYYPAAGRTLQIGVTRDW
jgi:outer membrane receptor protein involved in Fe transport